MTNRIILWVHSSTPCPQERTVFGCCSLLRIIHMAGTRQPPSSTVTNWRVVQLVAQVSLAAGDGVGILVFDGVEAEATQNPTRAL